MSDLASGLGIGLEGDRERLSLVVDAAPIAVIAVDRSGRVVIVNRVAEQLFGYSRDELLGDTLDRLIPEGSRAGHGALVAGYTRKPTSRTMGAPRSIMGRCKDGTEVPIEVGLAPVVLREGTFVLATIVNIGDHRRSELRLRAVIDSSPNALVLIDGAGKITLVNTQAEKLFGYRREELFGQSVEQLVPRRFRNIHVTQRNGFLKAPTARFMGAGRDLFGLCKDGREIPKPSVRVPVDRVDSKAKPRSASNSAAIDGSSQPCSRSIRACSVSVRLPRSSLFCTVCQTRGVALPCRVIRYAHSVE